MDKRIENDWLEEFSRYVEDHMERCFPKEYLPKSNRCKAPRREETGPAARKVPIEIPRQPSTQKATPVVPPPLDFYGIAVKAFAHGEYDRAEGLLGKVLAENPGNAKALTLLARICAKRGRLDAALLHIEEAIRADAMSPGRHYLHSEILEEFGRKQQAMEVLKKAVYLDPHFALAYFGIVEPPPDLCAIHPQELTSSRECFQEPLSD